ncbi:MAG: GTP-binding protein, partial [Nitrospiraceae bacterium]
MRAVPVECMRNVAVVSHAGSGKTSLVESLVHAAGAIPHLGSVLNGTTVSDFEPEEIHRRTSLNTSVLHFTYKDVGINLVDTPGASSFFGETLAALRAVDGVVLVISAASGMRSELVRLWSIIRELRLPCLVFVSELDKEGTSLTTTLEAMQAELEMTGIPLLLPNGTGGELCGVIDVIG